MKSSRVMIYVLGLIIVLLLIWQMYGVHHGKLNDIQQFNRVAIAAPITS